MHSKRSSEAGEQSVLDHGVIQHRAFIGTRLGVLVLELPSDCTVSKRNGGTSREGGTSVKDNVGPHPGHGAISQGRGCRLDVLVGLLVDLSETCQHIYVRDLNIVEQKETIV